MDKAARRYAAVLLAVFIFLFCANTLFIHTHAVDDGVYVVHSHPFLPNGHHSHSSQTLQAISFANAAMLMLDTPLQTIVPTAHTIAVRLVLPFCRHFFHNFHFTVSGRAPPFVLLSAI